MPYIKIATNTPIADEPAFLKKLSITTAELLGKSENYVMTEARSASCMTFGGSNEACAYVELISLGLNPNQHGQITRELSQFLDLEIGIPPERIYINFESPPRSHFGWNGKTFAD